jgi:hypothetical protein
MRILASNGNVGIGTTSPSASLQVSPAPLYVQYRDSTNTLQPAIYVENSTGNVGIGTTRPTFKLELSLPSSGGILVDSATTARIDMDRGSTAYGSYFVHKTAGTVYWTVGMLNDDTTNGWGVSPNGVLGSSKFYIHGTSYNVGIGTTSPNYDLVVTDGSVPEDSAVLNEALAAISVQGDGAAYFVGRDVTNDIEFAMGSSSLGEAFVASLTNHPLSIRTNNVKRMYIDTSGNVGIGTTSPSASLQVSPVNNLTAPLYVQYRDSTNTLQPACYICRKFNWLRRHRDVGARPYTARQRGYWVLQRRDKSISLCGCLQ